MFYFILFFFPVVFLHFISLRLSFGLPFMLPLFHCSFSLIPLCYFFFFLPIIRFSHFPFVFNLFLPILFLSGFCFLPLFYSLFFVLYILLRLILTFFLYFFVIQFRRVRNEVADIHLLVSPCACLSHSRMFLLEKSESIFTKFNIWRSAICPNVPVLVKIGRQ
jgi:hypothetical protein